MSAPSSAAALDPALAAAIAQQAPAAAGKTPPPPSTRDAAAIRSLEQAAGDLIDAGRRRSASRIVVGAVITMGVLLTWAGLAKVDEVTRGDGKVISSRQLQLIQSFDGGVVSEILVKEGQIVEKDQLLLKVDETRANSGARENAAQGLALQARIARLRALADGTPFKAPAYDATTAEAGIVEEEQRLFEMKRAELAATISINQQQVSQRQQELSEARSRRTSAARALDLGQQELNRTRPLLASGAVSEVDLIKLERDVSQSRGQMDQAGAQIERAQASIGEASRKVQEAELAFRNEARRDLAETLGRLNALNQSAVALNDKVDKSQIKSPVRGRVQRLLANTVGGVVQPGKDIVEIVPLDDVLVLEARVAPRDIAFIHPQQKATVKFTAYDYSIYGGLDAKVENISPDTVVDEKGNAYYLVRVRTDKAGLGEKLPIIPGMTAEVDVLTGSKSVLSYLLKPVLKVRERALRER